MTDLLTAAQMRSLEQAAIDAGEVTGLELMERAGQGVVDAILDWRPELADAREDGRPHRAAILCGPGNNGGDGFVVARVMQARGWKATTFLATEFPDPLEKLAGDAAINAKRWRDLDEILRCDLATIQAQFANAGGPPDLLVDAIFGSGLKRPLSDGLVKLFSWLAGHSGGYPSEYRVRHKVAIDSPSGVCMDSGRCLAATRLEVNPIIYDLTVTFHKERIGHHLGSGQWSSRELRVVDLGLEPDRLHRVCGFRTTPSEDHERVVRLSEALARAAPTRAHLRKRSRGHKYEEGHALVLSGGVGRGGAARLAARGALRVGAGLVTVGCPPAAVIENAARLDAIMLRPVADAAAFAALDILPKVSAVVVGPGFGVGERCRAMVVAELGANGGVEPHPTAGGTRRAVVLDADALTSFEDDPATLFAMLHEDCVLTPHQGEFGRLFPDLLEKLRAPAVRGPAYSKVDATREAAARAGCTVLFKGPDTVIASPDGRAAINSAAYERAAPWLATAGSGDVLAGFIAGLLARGFAPQEAAETAAWLHVECARKFGPGLIAEDLPEMLPAVFADLGL